MNKICLALESGGMRNTKTNGVLDFFLEEGLHIDHVSAFSSACISAYYYLQRQNGMAQSRFIEIASNASLIAMFSGNGLFNANAFHSLTDLPEGKTLEYGIYNCLTGEVEMLSFINSEQSIERLVASVSIPIGQKKQLIDGIPYKDGGMKLSIPYQHLLDKNYNPIIIMNKPNGYQRKIDVFLPMIKVIYKDYPHLIEDMQERCFVYNQALSELEKLNTANEVCIIMAEEELPVSANTINRNRLNQSYELGFKTGQSNYQRVKKFTQMHGKSGV